jgi:hypothetical protein
VKVLTRAILVLFFVSSSFVVGLLPEASPAGATQAPDPVITVDAPARGGTVRSGTRIFIGGWAADPASSSGPGVDASQGVQVSFGQPHSPTNPGVMVPYGSARPDVATASSRPDWSSTGFGGEVVVPPLPLGPWRLYVSVYFDRLGWQSVMVPIEVEVSAPVQENPLAGSPNTSAAPTTSTGPSTSTSPGAAPVAGLVTLPTTSSGIAGPTELRLVRASPIDVILRWRPPSGVEIASYRVYVSLGAGDCLVGSQGCPGTILEMSDTGVTILNLPYAPVRSFVVTGVTPAGVETDPSNRARFLINPDPFG